MEKSLLFLLSLLYFSGHNVTGIASPCETNDSSECIEYLGKAVLMLQERMEALSTQLEETKAQLRETKSESNKTKTLLNETRATVAELQYENVPIGYIYVQLPRQELPSSIWRTATWLDITYEYAGLFFRVLGGGSENFGVTQEENSPRLTNVQMTGVFSQATLVNVTPSEYSAWLSTGHQASGNPHWGVRFLVSGGEVRPRNEAVRIWKRVG